MQYKNLAAVQRLLDIYTRQLSTYKTNKEKFHASNCKFIVLEGLDGSGKDIECLNSKVLKKLYTCTVHTGKSTIAKILNERGFGVRWCTPPHDLWNLRPEFDSNPDLKTAFYALGNYIAAMQVANILQRRNVVMDRFVVKKPFFSMTGFGIF